MKLIYCTVCNDIIRLWMEEKSCDCGASKGHYEDEVNAVYSGPAIPLGMDNYAFKEAVESQPNRGMGKLFSAFVIPKECKTFRKVK